MYVLKQQTCRNDRSVVGEVDVNKTTESGELIDGRGKGIIISSYNI